MRIGIIAEGKEDQTVIINILRAFNIDRSDIIPIKPRLQRDETDANSPDNPTIGTFQGVKNACKGTDNQRPYFENAFNFSNIDYMVIHLDTAEIEQQDFAFKKPIKTKNPVYSIDLRAKTIALINEWLDDNYKEQLLYAIAIEEIEAWILTILEGKNTTNSANPKKRLKYNNKENLNIDELSTNFAKLAKLKKFAEFNESLKYFVSSIEVINGE